MILGLDAGSRTVAEAEHLLHITVKVLGLPAGTVGCTHFVRTSAGPPHVACSLTTGGHPVDLTALPARLGPELAAAHPVPVGAALSGETGPAGARRAGPHGLAEGAALAAAEHAARTGGRLVVFPGHAHLTGTLSVTEVLARSAIDHVVVLAVPDGPSPDALVVTNDHVRPQWRDGRVALLTMPASGDRLMPAEVPNPTPCCADHA
ncbi:hypothetical protein [Sphaerisporangium corydalis]|uniref:Universal stress protein n=1 Tax=Sphaerisporangium corydalis TaxID=1441875 RepID=A0ABV9EA14_9ACTN|nr:hypothetical protein [Sphaerisporangium corydalis]